MLGGALFPQDFLANGIRDLPEWKSFDDAALDKLAAVLAERLPAFQGSGPFEEATTEAQLIFPVLDALGWGCLPQQKMDQRRENIPDALLFGSPEAARAAMGRRRPAERFAAARVVAESKAWDTPLDRGERRTPASQVLRYLREAEELSSGAVRWAILTNGRLWRLYWQDARARNEEFLEADLPWLLRPEARENLRAFTILFGAAAFEPAADGRNLLVRARMEARRWEERVTDALSRTVFTAVFPRLLAALSTADPNAAPDNPAWVHELRDAALVLLYRLLFLLYAEDRDLLPRRNPRYAAVSITQLREELRALRARTDPEAGQGTGWWRRLSSLCAAVDGGRHDMGLPPYNGGLFGPNRAPLLTRVTLTDAAFAPILEGLAFRVTDDGTQVWLNYRDFSVQQLGTIYEALLERALEVRNGVVVPVADDTARHSAGIYYTRSAALVRFTLTEAVEPLLAAARDGFTAKLDSLKGDRRPAPAKCDDLARFDAAQAMLGLRICDPAAGSGHFLVTLTDIMADAILTAMADAAEEGDALGYISPLAHEVAQERAEIEGTARTQGWTLDSRLLEDRQIIRRLVLKRVIHGVDLNPLAVELCKLSLWLHSFTVGAPLSFLDHHIREGDSLLGATPAEIAALLEGGKRRGSALYLHGPLREARATAVQMRAIEALADADIVQVHQSQGLFEELERGTAPLRAFLDLLAARDLLPALKGAEKRARDRALAEWLDGLGGDPVALASGAAPSKPSVEAALGALRPMAEGRRFLHWPLAFPSLWRDLTGEGGFDAIVGNPPYVRQEQITPIKRALEARFPEVFDGVADLYVFFFAQALRVLKPGGRLSFIVNNKWLRAGYAEALRGHLATTGWLVSVTDFGHAKGFFPGVDAFPSVACVRRPRLGEAPPEEARICAISRDELEPEALAVQVVRETFPLPRAVLTREAWVLEPPEVRALMQRLRRVGPTLREYAGAAPDYGVKTGLNEAFVVTQSERDALVRDDPRCEPHLKRLLRGRDIDRWAADWDGQWLIVLPTSADHPWPWARLELDAAEALFGECLPSLHAHLSAWRDRLRVREDQGRFWWELRPCAYYAAFEAPKIVYPDIMWSTSFALDAGGHYSVNTTYILPAADAWVLAALNSPLSWWFAWRAAQHGKDEALRYFNTFVEAFPVPHPDEHTRTETTSLTAALADSTRARHATAREMRHWYAAQWGIEKPSRVLLEPWPLSALDFTAALKRALPRGRRGLTSADTALIAREHAATVEPMARRLEQAARDEAALSRLVNRAYGLTLEEEALLWRTAPPRMPLTAPQPARPEPAQV
jgi:SAM-dependent methyltransferase